MVPEAKRKSIGQRVKDLLNIKDDVTVKESDRFERMGYFMYPQTSMTRYRMATITATLDEVELTLGAMEEITDKDRYKKEAKNIRALFKVFMSIAGPFFRGLDNRELTFKAMRFFELETRCGHLPAFFPDFKKCAQALIILSWQAIDVVAQPPLLFETRTSIQTGGPKIDVGKATEEL